MKTKKANKAKAVQKSAARKETKPKPLSKQVEVPASAPGPLTFVETELPLAMLMPGNMVPNARTEFDELYIEELAANIQQYGLQNRLWVWPRPEPGPNGETHEIIAGECRWRSSQKTTLMVVPVKVFQCTRAEAIVLSLIDNLQRRNLNEVDEALGFKRLIDEAGMVAWDVKHPERSIGHKLNISKTAIYAALKLTELPQLGQQAVRAKEISASVAVRIARIPNPEMRQRALGEAIAEKWTDQRAGEQISRRYMTELKGAPFDTEDPRLNPERGACSTCPLRSGNQAEMFPDMAKGREDICTDPTCYRLKCAASFQLQADAHRKAGGKVLTEEEAEKAGFTEHYTYVRGDYLSLDEKAYSVGQTEKTYREIFAEELESKRLPVVLAQARDGSGKAYGLISYDAMREQAVRRGLLQPSKSREEQQAEAAQNALENNVAEAVRKETVRQVVERIERQMPDTTDDLWLRLVELIAVGLSVRNFEIPEILTARGGETPEDRNAKKEEWVDDFATNLPTLGARFGLAAELSMAALYWADSPKFDAFVELAGVDVAEIEKGVRLAMNAPAQEPVPEEEVCTKDTESTEGEAAAEAPRRWLLWEQLNERQREDVRAFMPDGYERTHAFAWGPDGVEAGLISDIGELNTAEAVQI